MISLTPEQLVSALSQFVQLPPAQRKLSSEQIAWFHNPENVFLLLYMAFTAPDEIVDDIHEDIIPWLETATAELATTAYNSSPETKLQMEQALDEILLHIKNESIPFSDWLMHALAALKRNHFSISIDLGDLLTENVENVIPLHAQQTPDFSSLLEQAEIRTGYDFVDFFEQGLSLLPSDAYADLFAQVRQYPWGVDAFLLLTQYFEKNIALASAQQLNQCTKTEWQTLSHAQLLTLCARFNRYPELAEQFKAWQKQAMQVLTPSAPLAINELYASHVDGNDCSTILLSTTINDEACNLSMMFDFKSGVRESLLFIAPDQSLQTLIEPLSHDSGIEFHPVNAQWLEQVLPWMLAVQQTHQSPLDIPTLFWLSQLPAAWTQPQPFDLAHWCHLVDYKTDAQRQENNRKTNVAPSMMTLTWLAPIESVENANQPKDILKGHYYADKTRYQQRLAYGASVDHFSLNPNARTRDLGLDLAMTLDDPALHRKKCPFFENLAEMSFEEYQRHTFEQQVIQEEAFTIKIELNGARPAIWRRVQVSNQLNLHELHDVIQAAMGWHNEHMSLFFQQNKPIDEQDYDRIQIGHLMHKKDDTLTYIYDFGDSWEHRLTLEKVSPRAPMIPKITAGNGACPEENCGGVWAWNDLLKMLKRSHLDDDDLERLEWCGLVPGQPAPKFEKQTANQTLQRWFGNT
ncbi:plasmid pRiA4b ORF-3 family protein [Vibrio alfacsensis]|uniref:plasmid pRiA4b ORF-3 family protein n=1 Tax=Vibrio alfacsensis TaxID=1074311 RepID=UPI00406800CA